MWPSNPFIERLKLRWPILPAPMGAYTTPALAAAVSNAGGLGGPGMFGCSAEEAERRIAGFRQQSGAAALAAYDANRRQAAAEFLARLRDSLRMRWRTPVVFPFPAHAGLNRLDVGCLGNAGLF